MTIKVAINGFGRIGRNFLRTCLDNTEIDIVCIPVFTEVIIEGKERTAIRLVVEPRWSACDLRYYAAPITDSNWVSATLVVPLEPSGAGPKDVFTVTAVRGGGRYFAVEAIDEMLHISGLSNVAQADIPNKKLYLPFILR